MAPPHRYRGRLKSKLSKLSELLHDEDYPPNPFTVYLGHRSIDHMLATLQNKIKEKKKKNA